MERSNEKGIQMLPTSTDTASTSLPWYWRKLTPPDHQCVIPTSIGFTLFCWLAIAICPFEEVFVAAMVAGLSIVLLVPLFGVYFQFRNYNQIEQILYLRFSFMVGVGAVHALATTMIIILRPSALPTSWMMAVSGTWIMVATIAIAELAAKRLTDAVARDKEVTNEIKDPSQEKSGSTALRSYS